MYEFIRCQWIMRRYTAEQVNACVTKKYITQDQADTILATEQVAEMQP